MGIFPDKIAGSIVDGKAPVRFFRAGGFDQLLLEKAADLGYLRDLDQTLWVASSCPTRGLKLDTETLDFVDSDGDGRIRIPEILGVVDWVSMVLKDASTLPEGSDSIRLGQINTDCDDGAQIYQTIGRIHENLGLKGENAITLDQALDRSGIFAVVKSNGDGVMPVSAAESEPVGELIQNILDTVGGVNDKSGRIGVTAEGVDAFYVALETYLDWWAMGHPCDGRRFSTKAVEPDAVRERGEDAEPGQLEAAMQKETTLREKADEAEAPPVEVTMGPELNPTVFVLGDQTPAALAAVNAIRDRVEDFYRQTEVAAFDACAVAFLNFNEADLQSLSGRRRDDVESMLKKVPLARVEGGAPLPLKENVNPAFANPLDTLNRDAVAVVLGEEKEVLKREEWAEILKTLAPYEQWLNDKTGSDVEPLGIERIGQLLRQPEHREALNALIQVDAALAAEIAAVCQVEKLLRLHRDLFRLLNNFVSLPEFYDKGSSAIFQMGTLFIDGCALNLCVEVLDLKQHVAIAKNSGIFLVYVTANRAGEAKDLTFCAAVTNRNVGRISVGKNAVFYDRFGNDWDARVIQVVENPISLRESVWAPFKKVGDLISAQMEKLVSSRQQAFNKSISSSITGLDKKVGRIPATPPPATPPPAPSNIGGLMAGGGVAIAAVSSSVAYLAQTLSKINDVYVLYTIFVIAAFVIGPSVILGFFKLRSRDIGMILEACGWAINGRMRINLALARDLTHIGKLPPGSIRIPYAYVEREARRRSRKTGTVLLGVALVAAAVLWYVIEFYLNR